MVGIYKRALAQFGLDVEIDPSSDELPSTTILLTDSSVLTRPSGRVL